MSSLSTSKPTAPGRQGNDGPKPAPGLYLVATPIGNLKDITLRALEVLAAADLVLCEDTRVSAKLLQAHGLSPRLKPYHEHNAARTRPEIIRRIENGEAVALISDAGTPLVSDPGYKLVRAPASLSSVSDLRLVGTEPAQPQVLPRAALAPPVAGRLPLPPACWANVHDVRRRNGCTLADGTTGAANRWR